MVFDPETLGRCYEQLKIFRAELSTDHEDGDRAWCDAAIRAAEAAILERVRDAQDHAAVSAIN